MFRGRSTPRHFISRGGSRNLFGQLASYFKYEGKRIQRSDIRNRPLPWGFLTETEIETLVRSPYAKRLGADLLKTTSPTAHDGRWFNQKYDRIGASMLYDAGFVHADVLEGALGAFNFIASSFSDDRPDGFQELDVCSPALSRFIDDVIASYGEHRVVPQLEVSDVEARILRVHIEEGNAQKPGQVLGLFDKSEISWYLSSGAIGPEAMLAMEARGQETGEPRRMVVTVQYRSIEKFWFQSAGERAVVAEIGTSEGEKQAAPQMPDEAQQQTTRQQQLVSEGAAVAAAILAEQNQTPAENEKQEKRMTGQQYHYWEFEADILGSERHWRVRNMNEVLNPVSGALLRDTRFGPS